MNRILYISLLLCAICTSMQATAQKVVVRDGETGDPIPFAQFYTEGRDRYIAADAQGEIDLRHITIPDTAQLTLLSELYSDYQVSYEAFRTSGEVRLTPKKQGIDAVAIYPEKQILEIVKKGAKYFADHYAKNYVAAASVLQTVRAGETYRKLFAAYGIYGSIDWGQKIHKCYWNDTHIAGVRPLDICMSYSYLPGSDKVNPLRSVVLQQSDFSRLERLYTDFVDWYQLTLLLHKRALELHAPLNVKQLKNFRYALSEESDPVRGKVFVIHFATRPEAFPQKTRFGGSGRIYMTEEGFPFRVETENADERYASYMHHNMKSSLVLVTPYTLRVEYDRHEGWIYTKSVTLEAYWRLPENAQPDDRFYQIDWNIFRNPFKHRHNSFTRIEFERPYLLDKTEAETISPLFSANQDDINLYTEHLDRDFWEKRLGRLPDFEQIRRDLTPGGVSLYDQTIERLEEEKTKLLEASLVSPEQTQQRLKTNYNYIFRLYKKIYGKAYNE